MVLWQLGRCFAVESMGNAAMQRFAKSRVRGRDISDMLLVLVRSNKSGCMRGCLLGARWANGFDKPKRGGQTTRQFGFRFWAAKQLNWLQAPRNRRPASLVRKSRVPGRREGGHPSCARPRIAPPADERVF